MIQRLLNEENLLIGISELSELKLEVSPRQLRYWEEKGIFLLLRSRRKRSTEISVTYSRQSALDQAFLDEGYTLQSAVEKAEEQHRNVGMTKKNL